MTSQKIAVLDRRVRVDHHQRSRGPTICRVSELRSAPFVVLLGEPGIGKSTVLALEAATENAIVRKVRDVVTGAALQPNAPAFIDALDEYRIDGASVDKAHGLGRAMSAAMPARWRLTCRAEDWKKSADLAAIRESAGGKEILVAQLQPLQHFEAVEVLKSLDEPDPERFMDSAYKLGAQSFLQSPLSLKLLHKAVSDGAAWPKTRYELFARAIATLAREHNDVHRGGVRRPIPQIVEAAEKTCLVLLLSGRRAIWRSHDEPPTGGDERAYLRSDELGLDDAVFQDMLDSSLFPGEGESFEPLHRTVAEYLASRALANAVAGSAKRAAFPLGRAIAVVTGFDRKAPTELRGLYSWLAAHLATAGREEDARQLIEADAATVLAYGDAAVFTTALRRAIFRNLDRDDPFFRSGDHNHDTAVGGLAGPDLAQDFAAELDHPTEGTHRLITVFEALTSGPSVESLRGKLWNIVLDLNRPGWQRSRAAEAWLNGAAGRVRELYDAIAATLPSLDRETLRLDVAGHVSAEAFSLPDIKSLITDFAATARTNTVGRLIRLTQTLVSVPRGELFDVDVDTWLSPKARQTHHVEIDGFVDRMLASAISKTPDLSPQRLWTWLNNTREYRLKPLGTESAKAVESWLKADATRETAILDLCIQDEEAKDAPWIAVNNFTILTRQIVSTALIRYVLATTAPMPVDAASKSRLAVAVHMAGRLKDEAVRQEVLGLVVARADSADLVTKLEGPPDEAEEETLTERREARRAKDTAQAQANVLLLTPHLEDIRAGRHLDTLASASKHYFASSQDERPVGVDRVRYHTNEEITAAILAGWRKLVTEGLMGVDAQSLGRIEGTSNFEFALLAGLDQWLVRDPEPASSTAPLIVAIAILKASWNLRDGDKRERFEHWALTRLNAEPHEGAAMLQAYLTARIDQGATHIEPLNRLRSEDAHGAAVNEALHAVLRTRPMMTPSLLRQALRAAAMRLAPEQLLKLAESAMADETVLGEQRRIWSFNAFALAPHLHGPALLKEHSTDGGSRLNDEFRALEYEPFGTVELAARSEREATIIRMVAPTQPPQDLETGEEDLTSTRADVIRRAIQLLSAYPEKEAGAAIKSLIADATLAAWKANLQHAYAQWSRVHRESAFRYPSPEAILGVLAGGPPVNAADLKVIVTEELLRLRRELRSGSNTPWKAYWNTDSNGNVKEPRIENLCRDRLLERLLDRLERYKITDALAEAQRPEDTRADMLVLNGAGKSLPIEVKRHYHAKLWTAPEAQLKGYTRAEGSEGYGIYLVFWFGLLVGAIPARKDQLAKPTTAQALEDMLIADLAAEDREQLGVLVFDVSKEATSASAHY